MPAVASVLQAVVSELPAPELLEVASKLLAVG